MTDFSQKTLVQIEALLARGETGQVRALATGAPKPLADLLLGTCAMIDGDLKTAQPHFETVLAQDPQDATARANLAVIHKRAGDAALTEFRPAKARDAYTAALEIAEHDLEALLGLAEAHQELCQFEDAVELYNAALPALETPADVLVRLGSCLLELRQKARAQEAFQAALRSDKTKIADVEGAYKTASCGQIWLNRTAFLAEMGVIS